jgi:hypothetical protein
MYVYVCVSIYVDMCVRTHRCICKFLYIWKLSMTNIILMNIYIYISGVLTQIEFQYKSIIEMKCIIEMTKK